VTVGEAAVEHAARNILPMPRKADIPWMPLMPGAVFLIIAAWCFARSSPRLEAWLLNHPTFGKTLRDWRSDGAIPRPAKMMACAGMTFGFVVFWFSADPSLALTLDQSVPARLWRAFSFPASKADGTRGWRATRRRRHVPVWRRMCRKLFRYIGIKLAEFAAIGLERFDSAQQLAEQPWPGNNDDDERDQQDRNNTRRSPIGIVAL
jgi:uncharacterized membrane protein YbaN (DUF454 family)